MCMKVTCINHAVATVLADRIGAEWLQKLLTNLFARRKQLLKLEWKMRQTCSVSSTTSTGTKCLITLSPLQRRPGYLLVNSYTYLSKLNCCFINVS